MANVYLVRQDTSQLYGEYLTAAVVVAESAKQAKKLVQRAAEEHQTEDGSILGFYPELIVVHKIGSNGNYGQGRKPVVCCVQTGERDDLPPGNYTPIQRRRH